MIGELLRRVSAALDANGIPYMLTGSLASSMYGIPRATNDIDIAGILKVQGDALDLPYIRRWVEQLHLGAQWADAQKRAV